MSSSANDQEDQVISSYLKNRDRNILVVRKIKRAVNIKLSHLFEGLISNVVDALFEDMNVDGLTEAEQAKSLERHFNITRALKTHGSLYKDEFMILMNSSWINLIKANNKKSALTPEEDVAATIKLYSDKNINQYKILLEELRKRFSGLIQTELDHHPMSPNNVYLCFWFATEKLALTPPERKLLIPLFNRFVMLRFGQVLSTVNQCLIEEGIESMPPELENTP